MCSSGARAANWERLRTETMEWTKGCIAGEACGSPWMLMGNLWDKVEAKERGLISDRWRYTRGCHTVIIVQVHRPSSFQRQPPQQGQRWPCLSSASVTGSSMLTVRRSTDGLTSRRTNVRHVLSGPPSEGPFVQGPCRPRGAIPLFHR